MENPNINHPVNKNPAPTGATAPNHFKELRLIMYKLPQKMIVPRKIQKGEKINNLPGANFKFMMSPMIIKLRE